MKLDKELVRKILLAIEESAEDPRIPKSITVEGASDQEVSYHVLLLAEAGFIEAQNMGTINTFSWRAQRLTYIGHEFLDAIRDPEIWRKTKNVAQKAGGAGIGFLSEIAKLEVKAKLGLP